MEGETMEAGSGKARTGRVRIGRTTMLALAVIWAGSAGYAAFAWRDGGVRHSTVTENPRVRLTEVGFTSWHGIVTAPDFPEYVFEETQLPSGDWVKQGSYSRRTRNGFVLEEGSFKEGRRDGRWVYWQNNGSLDVDRSGFYSNDARVKPGPESPTDWHWAFAADRS